jgi:hypothetical protein
VTDLELQPTGSTPRILLPGTAADGWIEGNCYPENAFAFFEPVMAWLREYRKVSGRRLTLNVKLDYFNTSSSKCLLDLFSSLQDAKAEGGEMRIVWHYCQDDSDMRESGEEFAQDLKIPFELRPY